MAETEYRRESSYPSDPEAMLPGHHHGHSMSNELIEYLKDYARERPEMAALWCFGIGFVLGWKLKPW